MAAHSTYGHLHEWKSAMRDLLDQTPSSHDVRRMFRASHRGEGALSIAAIFGAGLLAGAGLALLLAPKPGRELRGDLKRQVGLGGDAGSASHRSEGVPAYRSPTEPPGGVPGRIG